MAPNKETPENFPHGAAEKKTEQWVNSNSSMGSLEAEAWLI